jgi:dihydroflavonol-4-reductase
VAQEFAERGFPVVIVNPTAPVGDHDFKPTPTGKIVVDFARGAIPAYVDTGLNVVDVRDVARGHLAACERGAPGNATSHKTMLSRSRDAGEYPKRKPGIQIPYAVAFAAGVVSTGWANLTGKEPRAPLDAVRMSRKKMWLSHDKAARELGYAPGPAADALGRAVAWFRDNGYC